MMLGWSDSMGKHRESLVGGEVCEMVEKDG